VKKKYINKNKKYKYPDPRSQKLTDPRGSGSGTLQI
jgi:hypothetical protein